MSNLLLHENNWPLHCKACGCACPIDDRGKLHQNRIFCPTCFEEKNSGREQSGIPDNWVHMCNWEFMKNNFPQGYNYYLQRAIEERYASTH